MQLYFFVDLYGCVHLLTQICLMLITLYPSEILLRLIWSICSAFFSFVLFILINWSGIFKWYNAANVRWLWVSKRRNPYGSTKNTITYSRGLPEVPMNLSSNWLIIINSQDVKLQNKESFSTTELVNWTPSTPWAAHTESNAAITTATSSGRYESDAEAVSNAERNGHSCKQRQRMTAEIKILSTAYCVYCHQPLDIRSSQIKLTWGSHDFVYRYCKIIAKPSQQFNSR